MSFDLRPYQHEIIADVRGEVAAGKKRVLLGLATGGGKSVIAKDIIDKAIEKGSRSLLIAPRRKLIYQLFETLGRPSATSVIMSSEPFDKRKPIQLASSDSLRARLQRHGRDYMGRIDIILIDEVHINHGGKIWTLLNKHYPDAIYIGISATPIDENAYALKGWESLVYPYQTPDMVRMGYLVPPDYLAPTQPDLTAVNIVAGDYSEKDLDELMNDDYITKNAVEIWFKHGKSRQTMVFCVTIAHAEQVKKEFESHGLSVGIAHSKMNETEEEEHLLRFKKGEYQILVNVMKLTAGFDEKSIGCLLLLRPTKSVRLFTQIIGRGLRIDPENGKADCIILDCAGAVFDCGDPMKRRDFARQKPPKGTKKKPEALDSMLTCHQCAHIMMPSERQINVNETAEAITTTYSCPFCGAQMNENVSNKKEVELKRLQEEEFQKEQGTIFYAKMLDKFSGYKELQKVAKQAGYKNGWSWMNATAIDDHNLWEQARQIFMRVSGMGLPPSAAINELREIVTARGGTWK